jgi:small-conductance mechanosensitive channel
MGIAAAQTPEPTEPPAPTATGVLEEVVTTRTPAPTATPDRISEQVDEVVGKIGLTPKSFLGVSAADWINLGISIVTVVVGYLIGTWLIKSILPRLVQRTENEIDDAILQAVGPDIRWLVVVFILDFGTKRLAFVSAEFKAILADAYFVLGLLIAIRLVWRTIVLVDDMARQRSIDEGREDELAPLITLLVRVGYVIVVIVAVTILLSHFGINVTGFAALLGLGGLAFSLAAKDTISDAIAGFIILVDRPFRMGDRIEIQEIGTWGDVVEIGLRTTRIRTRDNRMVIVPNSVIGSNQVINYTFPDPQYRVQTHVGIAYGTDIEMVRQIIIDTVRHVEGVLPDRPVDALYIEMGDSAMIFRVRWWIESYEDTRRMFDRVHTALQEALDAAGVDMPFPTQSMHLQVEQGGEEPLKGILGKHDRGSYLQP